MFLSLRLVSISFILSILWSDAVAQTITAKKSRLYSLGWPVLCKFQPISYDCSFNESSEARFYYDYKMRDCKTFEYSDCEPSFNNFQTLDRCQFRCQHPGTERINTNYTANVYCRLQFDFGDCNSYYPMYYFDMSERKCKGFSYSGCGGNYNRFTDKRLCLAVCGAAVPYPKNNYFLS